MMFSLKRTDVWTQDNLWEFFISRGQDGSDGGGSGHLLAAAANTFNGLRW